MAQPGLRPGQLAGISYDQNAYAMAKGKQLFTWFNCSGCHSHGGGGMGPPLMDAKWLYGAEPENIFDSIADGRPNGMPAFRGRITDDQMWQLAAYVRALAGLARFDAAPSRDDGMQVKPAEQRMPAQPVQHSGSTTASAETHFP